MIISLLNVVSTSEKYCIEMWCDFLRRSILSDIQLAIWRIVASATIAINLYHLMDFGGRPFTAKVANTGDTVHSMDELVLIGAKCLREAVL